MLDIVNRSLPPTAAPQPSGSFLLDIGSFARSWIRRGDRKVARLSNAPATGDLPVATYQVRSPLDMGSFAQFLDPSGRAALALPPASPLGMGSIAHFRRTNDPEDA